MSIQVIRGDARALPLPGGSVDLVVTSPPYFGLRSYTDGGEHYTGQIGAEATPQEFLAALLEVTRECVRVLKPSGSLWVNLGDKYAGSDGSPGGVSRLDGGTKQRTVQGNGRKAIGAPTKSLIGVPWRYALACIDDLGLILRAEVIWSKPNGLPESVTDRVRRSHEQWFHFTLQPRYYAAVDEIREPHTWGRTINPQWESARKERIEGIEQKDAEGGRFSSLNHLGKLPGSVWTIPTEPLRVPPELGVDHFAAFPSEWPRRLILGWSPREVCTVCGEGRRPVVAHAEWWSEYRQWHSMGDFTKRDGAAAQGAYRAENNVAIPAGGKHVITGYACACPDTTAPSTPGVVLDPFGGTGTTAHVAHALGRQGISVDLSADYCRLAENTELQTARAAKALGVDKPAKQLPGQADLFNLDGAA